MILWISTIQLSWESFWTEGGRERLQVGLRVSKGSAGSSEGGEWLKGCRTQLGMVTHVHPESRFEGGFVVANPVTSFSL